MIPNERTKQLRRDLRETRAEMKAKGIKRISCFNGGLQGEVYSLNARVFRLETELKDEEKRNLAAHVTQEASCE